MELDIFHNFTTNLKKALSHAVNLAIGNKEKHICPKHLIIGLIEQKGSLGSEILAKCGLKTSKVADQTVTSSNDSTGLPSFSEQAKKIIEKAALIASQNDHQYTGTEHLLASLLENSDEEVERIFKKNQVDTEYLNQQTETILKSTSKYSEIADTISRETKNQEAGGDTQSLKNQALEYFCTNLSDKNVQKKIDPVIGRQQEIERLTQILARRTKNNPILIGEAGVGKTAIVEGLAKKISQKKVPEILINKKIYSLDLGSVIAGTMYRGEFEARFKQIIDEIKNDPNIILFIDEIHTIMGAGSTGMSGGLDAANILKPTLAKGETRCIGATTSDEYKKHIESDTALERRFQLILVEEPTQEETTTILKGIRENYEKHHQVKITDQAIQTAAELSTRYLPEKNLPDKAIDLIDEAAAKFRTKTTNSAQKKEAGKLIKELEVIKKKKEDFIIKGNFKKAIELKEKSKQTKQKIDALKNTRNGTQPAAIIDAEDITEVISKITKIPLQELITTEKERLLKIENELNKFIIGQKEATKTIADFIRRSRAGLADRNRPIGSFIFLGPSGVGKTELAKVVAKTLFKDDKALIRIDMSEFSESFNASKLIGAPAGYVGYKDSTKLTDQIRRRPYSVVLFDEIEKAHHEIFNLLLQILEDGHLTDATGKVANFKNAVIIMTSNIGLENLNKGAAMGFGAKTTQEKTKAKDKYEKIKESVLMDLEKNFRPEFLNRIDKTIVFKPLETKHAIKITELHLKEIRKELREKEISFTISRAALSQISQAGFKPEQGARAIRSVISELITSPLAEKILKDQFQPGDKIKIKTRGKELVMEK